MIYDVRFMPAKGRGKTCWRFSELLHTADGVEYRIEGYRYWPESGDVKPPIFLEGRKQFWPVKINQKGLDKLAAEIQPFVQQEEKVFSSVVKEKKRAPGRNWSDELLELNVLCPYKEGDNDILRRMQEREDFLQGDIDYVLGRVKELY